MVNLLRDSAGRAAEGVRFEIQPVLAATQPDDPVTPCQSGCNLRVALACIHAGMKDENDSPLSLNFCVNACPIRRYGGQQVVFLCVPFAILHRNQLLITDTCESLTETPFPVCEASSFPFTVSQDQSGASSSWTFSLLLFNAAVTFACTSSTLRRISAFPASKFVPLSARASARRTRLPFLPTPHKMAGPA